MSECVNLCGRGRPGWTVCDCAEMTARRFQEMEDQRHAIEVAQARLARLTQDPASAKRDQQIEDTNALLDSSRQMLALLERSLCTPDEAVQ